MGPVARRKMSSRFRSGIEAFALTLMMSWLCWTPVLAVDRCQKPSEPESVQRLQLGSIERHYRMVFPDQYEPSSPQPLVILLHGWGGNENSFFDDQALVQQAKARGVILVAPRGLGDGAPDFSYNSWSFRGSNSGVGDNGLPICDSQSTPDYRYDSCKEAGTAENSCAWTHCQSPELSDTQFLVELIRVLETEHCVDAERIYLFGGSNGGNLAWDVAVSPELASKVAAFASLIGLPHQSSLAKRVNVKLPPALLITGLNDTTDPPGDWDDFSVTTTSNGSDRYFYESASSTIRNWSWASGCSVSEQAITVNAPQPFDCRTYCPGEFAEAPAIDCRLDMGHEYQLDKTWPLALDFFLKRVRRPEP